VPTGDPVLGCSIGDRQLLGHHLEDSNASSGHARDCSPTPERRAPSDRRSGTRSARTSATTAGLGVIYVPTHERPITWDICREPRHPGGLWDSPVNQRVWLQSSPAGRICP
jgi:hypothetical protein